MDAQVCIFIPPSPFLMDERVFPFLGPLKVAASLEGAGIPVEVPDLSGYRNYTDIVEEYASAHTPVFGLTATTPQFPAAVKIVETIRRIRKDARIILGGPHATLVAAALKQERAGNRLGRAHRAWSQLENNFDVIVAGDGELAIFAALQSNAPQLIDADDRKSEYWLTNQKLDATPFPARHLIELPTYRYTIEGAPATSLIAQLGCPYKCGFCAGRASPMLRNIRMRSDENIVEELKFLYRTYGYTGFMFYDDELNVNPGIIPLMEKIAKAQRDLGVTWKLRGFVKSERFTDEQAKALYEAGFRWLLVGFESGSPRILKNIEKIATQEDNTRCMDIARRNGLKVKALMSIGHPGESRETIQETHQWLIDVRPADFDATIITPYPGSPYYDQAIEDATHGRNQRVFIFRAKNGDRLYQTEVDYSNEADYYKGDPNDGYVSHVWTDHLEGSELVRMRNDLERDIRHALNIPFNPSRASTLYEHSMGQTALPSRILRRSASSTKIRSA